MTDPERPIATAPLEPVRLLYCVLPDDGTDRRLIRALREQWGITVASSIACRGVSALRKVTTARPERLPEPSFVKLVQIVVPEAKAAALFDYVYTTARIGRPDGGAVLLGQPIHATPFQLPDDLPDEAA